MCGRYTLKRPERLKEASLRAFGVSPEFVPRFNVSPSQLLPVIARSEGAGYSGSIMKWGLVPFWDKSEKPKIAPINARSEDVLSKPMFKQSLQRRRCIVPADGFFEWKKVDPTTKIPYHIQMKGAEPFWFAGIFENETENRPASFALLTTTPNELMSGIHNRMPVIVSDEQAKDWLDRSEVDRSTLEQFTRPYAAERMECFSVSRIVNVPKNDVPECVIPAAELTHDEQAGPNSA